MNNIQQLLQQRQNEFIEKRTRIKAEVDKFMVSIQGIDKNYLEGIVMPTGVTTEEILPELWHEPFDSAKYAEELKQFKFFESQIREVTDKINEEALRCLSQK